MSAEPYRTEDIHDDPRFRGWWPRQHPDMRSFLGVPIVSPDGTIIGAFYLTEKDGADAFDAEDQELIELLAAHASIAITNARLYEQSRELSILSERNRLALELHDVVSQKLFSVMLTAEAAATQMDRDLVAARAQIERLRELAREALEELRSLILGLRPAELERDGLEGALRKEVEMLGAVHGTNVDLEFDAGASIEPGERELALLRIAHEALHNAVRHAHAEHVSVRVGGTGRCARRRGHRRRGRVRPRPARASFAAPRADVDGGARPRASRSAPDPLRSRRRAPPSGSS